MNARLFLWTSVVLVAGCGIPATQALLHVSAESEVAARARTLCVSIESEFAPPQFQCHPSPRAETDIPVFQAECSDGFKATLSLLDQTQEIERLAGRTPGSFIQTSIQVRYEDGTLLDLDLQFEDACIEVTCEAEQSCVGGSCVPVPTAP